MKKNWFNELLRVRVRPLLCYQCDLAMEQSTSGLSVATGIQIH